MKILIKMTNVTITGQKFTSTDKCVVSLRRQIYTGSETAWEYRLRQGALAS